MTKPESTPKRPTHFHCVPGDSLRKAPAVLVWVWRPMMNSLIMMGIPSSNTQPTYTMMKAAPPFWPVSMGKRHILPRPTAEPAAASTAPSLLPKFSRELLSIKRIP